MAFNVSQHRNILLKILKDIYSQKDLGPILGFKGGTAAHLFYGLNRFSVDLDFDLLKLEKDELVLKRVEEIISQYGEVKDVINKNNTLFFLLSYKKGFYKVKIEINKRNFNSSYELKTYLGISMLVMVSPDMFSHKLVALIDRKKVVGRDIFDINFFLKNDWPINEEIIKLRTGDSLYNHLIKLVSLLESISEKTILSGLGELLNEQQKIWVKNNLVKDTIFLLKLKIEELES